MFAELRRRHSVKAESSTENPLIEDGRVRADFVTRRGVVKRAVADGPLVLERQLKGLLWRRNRGWGRGVRERRQPRRAEERQIALRVPLNVFYAGWLF